MEKFRFCRCGCRRFLEWLIHLKLMVVKHRWYCTCYHRDTNLCRLHPTLIVFGTIRILKSKVNSNAGTQNMHGLMILGRNRLLLKEGRGNSYWLISYWVIEKPEGITKKSSSLTIDS